MTTLNQALFTAHEIRRARAQAELIDTGDTTVASPTGGASPSRPASGGWLAKLLRPGRPAVQAR